MRERFRHEVRAYVGHEVYSRLLREAAARGITVSQVIRNDLAEYYAIRDELAAPLEVQAGSNGEPARRIIHRLLNEMEVRLVASLDRLSGHFWESLEFQGILLASMIDQVYLGVMLHSPDVPEELRKERVRRGNDRHAAWRESVATLVREGGPKLPPPAAVTERR
jgi:hypothetical protein